MEVDPDFEEKAKPLAREVVDDHTITSYYYHDHFESLNPNMTIQPTASAANPAKKPLQPEDVIKAKEEQMVRDGLDLSDEALAKEANTTLYFIGLAHPRGKTPRTVHDAANHMDEDEQSKFSLKGIYSSDSHVKKQVGTIFKSKKCKDGILAFGKIDGSTRMGQKAIVKFRAGYLTDLSLGHKYYFGKHVAMTDKHGKPVVYLTKQINHLALVDKGNREGTKLWMAVPVKSGSETDKAFEGYFNASKDLGALDPSAEEGIAQYLKSLGEAQVHGVQQPSQRPPVHSNAYIKERFRSISDSMNQGGISNEPMTPQKAANVQTFADIMDTLGFNQRQQALQRAARNAPEPQSSTTMQNDVVGQFESLVFDSTQAARQQAQQQQGTQIADTVKNLFARAAGIKKLQLDLNGEQESSRETFNNDSNAPENIDVSNSPSPEMTETQQNQTAATAAAATSTTATSSSTASSPQNTTAATINPEDIKGKGALLDKQKFDALPEGQDILKGIPLEQLEKYVSAQKKQAEEAKHASQQVAKSNFDTATSLQKDRALLNVAAQVKQAHAENAKLLKELEKQKKMIQEMKPLAEKQTEMQKQKEQAAREKIHKFYEATLTAYAQDGKLNDSCRASLQKEYEMKMKDPLAFVAGIEVQSDHSYTLYAENERLSNELAKISQAQKHAQKQSSKSPWVDSSMGAAQIANAALEDAKREAEAQQDKKRMKQQEKEKKHDAAANNSKEDDSLFSASNIARIQADVKKAQSAQMAGTPDANSGAQSNSLVITPQNQGASGTQKPLAEGQSDHSRTLQGGSAGTGIPNVRYSAVQDLANRSGMSTEGIPANRLGLTNNIIQRMRSRNKDLSFTPGIPQEYDRVIQ